MKKFISIFMVFALSLVLALNVGATEVIEPIDTDMPEDTDLYETAPESETLGDLPVTDTAEAVTDAESDASAAELGEGELPIDEWLLRMWDQYRDTIFAALSTVFSIIVAQAFKNMSVAGKKKDAAAKKKEEADKKANDEFRAEIRDRLAQFENYDELSKQMKDVLAESQLDREVLVKVIEMQAGQVNQLIEFSSLPQARKDQIYAGYRAQLREIARLKGEGDGEA